MSCKYCSGDEPLYDYGCHELRIVDGWTNRYGQRYPGWQLKYKYDQSLDCNFDMQINFCPMCGKRLRDESEEV